MSASFSYTLYPDLNVKGTLTLPNSLSSFINGLRKCLVPTPTVNYCISIYHSWSADIGVDPWYQRREVTTRVTWRGVEISVGI